jgi:GNAT superfamily N-acetyltransferase
MQWQRENFIISTDSALLDIGFIHEYLTNQSYWAQGRPWETVEKSVQNSLCFGVFDGVRQVGFARVVTDYCTFAWLCDVFITEAYKGHGLGKWLVECVVAHPELQSAKNILLATRDAHELYRRYGGFDHLSMPEKWMRRSGASFNHHA